jgi:ATP-dependent DNA helicase DinG
VPRAIDSAHIEAVFADDGPLKTMLPGYRVRRAQVDMALQVAKAIDTPWSRLVVEAGTGTGKSLAYLVPALLSGSRVVVATGTKALQDQLVDKDAPIARAAVNAILGDDKDRPVMRLKGRTNYLCKLRYENFERQGTLGLGDAGADALVQLTRFAQTTRTGDRAEMSGLSETWRGFAEVDANRDQCLGQSCPRYDECFVVLARRQAEAAAVVVVNHHLLCADQRLRLESSGYDQDGQGFGVLPNMDVLVIDEAHALADVATDHFGVSISSEDITRLAADIRRAADALGSGERTTLLQTLASLEQASQAFFVSAVALSRTAGSSSPPSPSSSRDGDEHAHRVVFRPNEDVRTAGDDVGAVLKDLGDDLDEVRASFDDDAVESVMQKATFAGLKERAIRVRAQLLYMAGPAASDVKSVCFVHQGARSTTLTSAPIDVRGPLSATVFSSATPVILTSATLAVGTDVQPFIDTVGLAIPQGEGAADDAFADGASFDAASGAFVAASTNEVRRLHGLRGAYAEYASDADIDGHAADEDANEDDVGEVSDVVVMSALYPSPFDHRGRAALYAPTAMPNPDHTTYAARFDDEVRFLLQLSRGGMLVLFTSRRAMDDAARRLANDVAALGLPLLRQGDRPKGVLLDELRRHGHAVLFATASFWEGVDIVGPALRVVVIDRLPFRVPSDPLVQARNDQRKAEGKDPFKTLALPEAALALKQGAGRLLRSVDDAGVVAVLDGRLRSKSYGNVFLEALPPMTRLGSQRTVQQFWERVVAPALGLDAAVDVVNADDGSIDVDA